MPRVLSSHARAVRVWTICLTDSGDYLTYSPDGWDFTPDVSKAARMRIDEAEQLMPHLPLDARIADLRGVASCDI
jgi:hypothetical protein